MDNLWRRIFKSYTLLCLLLLGILTICGCTKEADRLNTDYLTVLSNMYCGGTANFLGNQAYLLDYTDNSALLPDGLFCISKEQILNKKPISTENWVSDQVKVYFPTENAVFFCKMNGGIYKYTIATKQIQKLSDETGEDLAIYEDKLFFKNQNDELCMLLTSGTDYQVLDKYHNAYNLWPTGDALYFISRGDNPNRIYRYLYATKDVEMVTDARAERIFVVENRIYYIEASKSLLVQDLFMYDMSAGSTEQLTEKEFVPSDSANIYNGYLIYCKPNEFRTVALDLSTHREIILSNDFYQFSYVVGSNLFTDHGVLDLAKLQ